MSLMSLAREKKLPPLSVSAGDEGQKRGKPLRPSIAGQAIPTKAPGMEAQPVSGKIKATPLAKKLARRLQVDLSLIRGTGPSGRIVKRDFLKVADGQEKAPLSPLPLQGEEIPLSAMRETIARRMIESFQLVPHFYISVEADAEALSDTYQQLKPQMEKSIGLNLTLTDLLLRVIARALEEHPEINIQWTGKGLRRLLDCNIGLPHGLIVPVIRQANRKSLVELVKIRTDLVGRAQQGKIRMDEMRGGSLTLTNLGMFGIDSFNPIINPPESCILATGRILEKPVGYRGQIALRKRMNLTLALDHRVLDGVRGTRFLQRIRELIEQPILLL